MSYLSRNVFTQLSEPRRKTPRRVTPVKGLVKRRFLKCKAILAAIESYGLSQKPLFCYGPKSCYVEAGEFPNLSGPWGH